MRGIISIIIPFGSDGALETVLMQSIEESGGLHNCLKHKREQLKARLSDSRVIAHQGDLHRHLIKY